MKKNDRLELIRKIVQENKITTQGELVKLLQNEGLKATQATVSRDINEIGITKVPTEDGSYIYGLSTAPRRVGGTSVVTRRLLRVDRQHAFMNILLFLHSLENLIARIPCDTIVARGHLPVKI